LDCCDGSGSEGALYYTKLEKRLEKLRDAVNKRGKNQGMDHPSQRGSIIIGTPHPRDVSYMATYVICTLRTSRSPVLKQSVYEAFFSLDFGGVMMMMNS
jgi:hypothetical protein